VNQKIIIVPTEETEDLLPGYLERRRSEVITMEEALLQKDFQALTTFGHNVKGTAGSYGLPQLGDLADEVHSAALEKNELACRQTLAAYRNYLERVELG
jgi:HPt (histidine-containing phosphotransfer) domain-containing protein